MGRTSDARERLLESGSALMHQRGYTAVGVSELCSQAGVKKGSFYHFFPSKVELALAVVDRHRAETQGALEELVNGDAPPLERLAAYAKGIWEHQVELRRSCGQVLGCPIGNLALEMSTQEPELRKALDQVFERNIESLERAVQEAIERSDLRPLDAHRAACSILSLIEGSIMLAKMKDDPQILRDLKRNVLRLLGADTRSQN